METDMKFVRFFFGLALAPLLVSSADAQLAVAGGFAGCKDRDNMRRVLELTDQDDIVAAQELIVRGIKSEDCRIIPMDAIVFEVTPPFTRLIKAHIRGNPDVYWIIQ
jgi:hypothetical protein